MQYRNMIAILSAHSPETSMAEYALPEDAFRGISPADKSSWAAVGAAFNSAVFPQVEASYADYVQAEPVVEEAEVQQEAPPGDCNHVRVYALVTTAQWSFNGRQEFPADVPSNWKPSAAW